MSLSALRAICPRFVVSLSLVVIALFAAPRSAHAGDLEDFVYARDAYNNSDYEVAIQRLQNLLDRQPPVTPLLVEPIREFLFASLLLTDHRDQAIAQLERILRNNPDVQFAPRDFSGAVMQLVNETRLRLANELTAIRANRIAATNAANAERERRRQALIEQLTRQTVVTRTSRAWMFVPFGGGQFVNRQYALGSLFATLETGGLVTAVASSALLLQLGLSDHRGDLNLCRASACPPLFIATAVGWSVFGAALVAGIIQANAAFVPERTEIRRQPVGPDLQRIQLSFGPTAGGAAASVGWQF